MDEKYKNKAPKEQHTGLIEEPTKYFCEKCGKEIEAVDAISLKSFGQKVLCQDCLREKPL